MYSEREIAKMLLDIEAVTIRDTSNLFTWVSGIKSPIYCDNRLTMGYPKVRDYIAESFKETIEKEYSDIEVVAGTATAGIPHAAWLAQKLELPMIYVRGSHKEHGKGNIIEGRYQKGNRVVLIEDLLSTGGSSLKAVKALREAGVDVLGVLGIFSYDFPTLKESFKRENLNYKTLTSYNTLLSIAVELGYVNREEFEVLKKWSEDPYRFTKVE